MPLNRGKVDGRAGAQSLSTLGGDDGEGRSLVVGVRFTSHQAGLLELSDGSTNPFAAHDCLLAQFGHPEGAAWCRVDHKQDVVPGKWQAGRGQRSLDLRE